MKINDGNRVQGLYNANITPLDAMFTYGDIVVKGSTLYTCKGDTTVPPSLNDPNWEVYMGDNWSILNSYIDIENYDPLKVNYIGPQGLSEFIKTRLGGLNSNGRLQLLDDPSLVELSSLTQNSVFQLSYDYLVHPEVEPLPFIPHNDKVYVIRTIGELNNTSNIGLFIQEIIEYPITGTYRSWVRFGEDLSLATWTPTRGESFDSTYIQALDNIVQNYIASKEAYDTLVENIHQGNYYSFELVPMGSARNYIRFIEGTELISVSEIILNPDFHYKIFLRKDLGGGNFNSLSIDVTPEDFIFAYEPLARINYNPNEVYLLKDSESSPEDGWTLAGGTYSISRILKAKHLIS